MGKRTEREIVDGLLSLHYICYWILKYFYSKEHLGKEDQKDNCGQATVQSLHCSYVTGL